MNRQITRREAALGAAAVGLSGCRREPGGPKPLVSIVKAATYGEDLLEKVRSILTEHKLNVRGRRVVLKPNLVEFNPSTSINTSPVLVAAAVEAFRSLGATSVRIAEGPANRRDTLEIAEAAGYFASVRDFEARFTDLNLDDVTRVNLKQPHSKLRYVYLPDTVLGADLLVSMPKMKTHHWAVATLSMKNLFGLVPGSVYGWPKNILHWSGISECVADLHGVIPKHFAIVDGIIGMEGNGPLQGTPKAAGVIVAGADLIAVDATCCRIMGIDPGKVPYLKLAEDRQQLRETEVQQVGESVAAVRTDFQLIRPFNSLRWKA